MFSIFSSALNALLWPIKKILFHFFYGIFVTGPLWVLNTEDKAVQYAIGGKTDELIFDTSLVDGDRNLNFFSTTGIVHNLFMVMFGIAGTMMALTIGFMVLSSLYKSKSNPIKKMIRLSLSTTTIFAVPLLFLTGLSLSGAFISSLSNKAEKLTRNDISKFSDFLPNLVSKIQNANLQSLDQNQMYLVKDISANTQNNHHNSQKSERDIYYALMTGKNAGNNYKVDDELIQEVKHNHELYLEINNLILDWSNGKYILRKGLKKKLGEVKEIASDIRPADKSEKDAGKIKDIRDYFSHISDLINQWKLSADEIFKYRVNDLRIAQDFAVSGFEVLFNHYYGEINSEEAPNLQINGLKSFQYAISILLDGTGKYAGFGLNSLKRHLTNFTSSPLVISFYRIITGNKDDLWDKPVDSIKNKGIMLIIGFITIIGAIMIMAAVIIESLIRISVLGALFIISPVVVGLSTIDDGRRMKNWLNAVLSQFISVFGVLIVLRMGGVLIGKFREILERSGEFGGSSGTLLRNILVGLFAFSTLIAAKQSKSIFASIAGSSQGIMSAMQGFSGIKTILSGGGVIRRGASRLSEKSKNTKSYQKISGAYKKIRSNRMKLRDENKAYKKAVNKKQRRYIKQMQPRIKDGVLSEGQKFKRFAKKNIKKAKEYIDHKRKEK